jgi:hypothetical protein
VNFEMKLYNDQRNAQIFNLFIYLVVSHVSGFPEAHLQKRVYKFGSGLFFWVWVSAWALTPQETRNHYRDGLKESPKNVRQK